MYDIGLPSHKSLFQLQAERIRRLSELAGGVSIPWYIMTSEATHAATVAYFAQHAHFGLPPQDVRFFKQGEMPCVSLKGCVLLATPTTVRPRASSRWRHARPGMANAGQWKHSLGEAP